MALWAFLNHCTQKGNEQDFFIYFHLSISPPCISRDTKSPWPIQKWHYDARKIMVTLSGACNTFLDVAHIYCSETTKHTAIMQQPAPITIRTVGLLFCKEHCFAMYECMLIYTMFCFPLTKV